MESDFLKEEIATGGVLQIKEELELKQSIGDMLTEVTPIKPFNCYLHRLNATVKVLHAGRFVDHSVLILQQLAASARNDCFSVFSSCPYPLQTS